jgi:hypothetical protein
MARMSFVRFGDISFMWIVSGLPTIQQEALAGLNNGSDH